MNSPNKSRGLFVYVLLAILLAGAAIFCIQAILSINVQQDIKKPESAIVLGVVRLWRGEPLYRDFHQAPFVIMPYAPLFYMISAGISKLFAHSIHSVYVCARIVALTATILTAIIVAKIVGHAKCGRAGQCGGALLFLGSSLMLPWGFTARVDSLMLLFTIIGLSLFLRFKGSNWQYLAVIAFVLAIFSKQSAMAAPAAVVGMLALERKWRQALLFGVGVILLSTACFMIGNHLTEGLLDLNVLKGISSPIRWQSAWELFGDCLSGLLLPLALSIVPLFPFLRDRLTKGSTKESEPVIALFGLFLLASLGVAVLTSTKLGSDRNYYLSSLLAASVLGGIGIEWLIRSSKLEWLPAILTASLIIAAALPDLKRDHTIMTEGHFVTGDNSSIIESLRDLPGDILTDDANIPLRLGKPVFASDAYNLSVMISTGTWKPDPLISLIEQKHFDAVILPYDLRSTYRTPWAVYQGMAVWDEHILKAINDNYAVAETPGLCWIYHKR